MRSGPEVLAVLTSDWHLTHTPPVVRSVEGNWYEVQRRYLSQIEKLATKHKVPIIVAGDIFDKPSNPPEFVNWLMEVMPANVYAIPGQHDLPLHNYEDRNRSSYWTLVLANIIHDLAPGEDHWLSKNRVCVRAFPWGFGIEPAPNHANIKKPDGALNHVMLAVVHKYIWRHDKSGLARFADKSDNWKKTVEMLVHVLPDLMGYDAAVYGDNHQGFYAPGKCNVFNCGTMMRRKADEINYSPQVGLLMSSGHIEPHRLNCEADKFLDDAEKLVTNATDAEVLKNLINQLETMGNTVLDFVDQVKRSIREQPVSKKTRNLLLKALEQNNGKETR